MGDRLVISLVDDNDEPLAGIYQHWAASDYVNATHMISKYMKLYDWDNNKTKENAVRVLFDYINEYTDNNENVGVLEEAEIEDDWNSPFYTVKDDYLKGMIVAGIYRKAKTHMGMITTLPKVVNHWERWAEFYTTMNTSDDFFEE